LRRPLAIATAVLALGPLGGAALACDDGSKSFESYRVAGIAQVINVEWSLWTGKGVAYIALVQNVRGSAPPRGMARFNFYPWSCSSQRFHVGQTVFAFYPHGVRDVVIMPTDLVADADLNKARMALK
jgi:hypothetical protein